MNAQPTASQHGAQHLVSRVIWDTGFDAPEDVRAQQDWLSAFSRTALPQLFDAVFAQECPERAHWRCDRLVLELGDIAMSDLAEELPRRLRRALADALHARFDADRARHDVADTRSRHDQTYVQQPLPELVGSARTLSSSRDDLTLLEHLLSHGSLPWWREEPLSLITHWDTLCATDAASLVACLWRIGRDQNVRERLVWQLGVLRMPALLRLLLPTQAEALNAWVSDLVGRQISARLVPDRADDFEHEAWLALLTCLMADRGNASNTVNFAHQHLQRLAARYGIACDVLLARLLDSCERHAPVLSRGFVGLVRAVCAHARPHATAHLPQDLADDWQQWSALVAQASHVSVSARRPLRSLFLRLARREPERLARQLREMPAAVVASILQYAEEHADAPTLRHAVAVLAPAHSPFILAHIASMQGLASRDGLARRMVWQLVITALLSAPLPRFDRAVLVEETLRTWCRQHNRALAPSLAALVYAVRAQSPAPQRYALLRILVDLQHAEVAQHPAQDLAQGLAEAVHEMLQTQRANRPRERPHQRQQRQAPATPSQAATPPQATSPSHLWTALRWRLRKERAAPGVPQAVAALSLAELWQQLPEAALRRWLLRQPDRDRLLPALLAVPGARRWLHRLVPRHLRAITTWIDAMPDAWCQQICGGEVHDKPRRVLESILWRLALDSRTRNATAAECLAQALLHGCRAAGIAPADCAHHGLGFPLGQEWRQACLRLLEWGEGRPPSLPDAPPPSPPTSRQAPRQARRDIATRHVRADAWGAWLQQPEAQARVLRLLCRRGPVPCDSRHGVAGWPEAAASTDPANPEARLAMAVFTLAWQQPQALRRLLAKPWQRITLQPQLERRLRKALPMPQLLDLLRRSPGGNSALVSGLQAWQTWQRQLSLPHAQAREAWLWRVVWEAWLNQDWRRLDLSRLIAAFCQWYLPLSGQSAPQFARGLRATAATLPNGLSEALLASLGDDGMLASEHVSIDMTFDAMPDAMHGALPSTPPLSEGAPAQHAAPRASDRSLHSVKPHSATPHSGTPHYDGRWPVPNAGLVLLHGYWSTLFERLGLLRDRRFIDTSALHRAVLSLHYLACGHCIADEPQLALNKVLCGEPPDRPVPLSFAPEAEDIALMDGLLHAVCSHWPKSGSTTADALRGNWLLRKGVLSDADDHWRLVVERKPWDVLLASSPFTSSIVKPPWMTKPLYVTWLQ